jgi:hypothetical protein
MADLSDSELFDSVASGNSASELQPEPVVTQPSSQPRDDSGRFASQQVETPAQPQAPAVEPQPQTPEQPPSNGNAVPVGAVQAEREKRQEAQREAEALRREIAELRGMVQAVRQPTPQPQQEKQPVSIFEDPEAFLQSQFDPYRNELNELKEQLWESRAASIHTQEAVDAAKEAANALAGTPQGRALHQQITTGGNPFDNLVKWHKQQQAYARVGNDPDAWLNSEIEKRLSDPTFLAQAVERARAGATPAPGNRQQQPVTSIPPSLARLPAGGNAPPQGDTSDGALFDSVTSRRRG